jgi:hypothetical protein
MARSKKARRANKPARNGNQLYDQLSPEERAELRKRHEMEKLWEEHGGHSRFIGTWGTKGKPKR